MNSNEAANQICDILTKRGQIEHQALELGRLHVRFAEEVKGSTIELNGIAVCQLLHGPFTVTLVA